MMLPSLKNRRTNIQSTWPTRNRTFLFSLFASRTSRKIHLIRRLCKSALSCCLRTISIRISRTGSVICSFLLQSRIRSRGRSRCWPSMLIWPRKIRRACPYLVRLFTRETWGALRWFLPRFKALSSWMTPRFTIPKWVRILSHSLSIFAKCVKNAETKKSHYQIFSWRSTTWWWQDNSSSREMSRSKSSSGLAQRWYVSERTTNRTTKRS